MSGNTRSWMKSLHFTTFKITFPLTSLTGNQRLPALMPMINTSSLCLRFNSKEQVRVYLNIRKIKVPWNNLVYIQFQIVFSISILSSSLRTTIPYWAIFCFSWKLEITVLITVSSKQNKILTEVSVKFACKPSDPSPKSLSPFHSMKWLGVFLLPPGWDASPSQGYTQH